MERAAIWLKDRSNCTIITRDIHAMHTQECPDALGFKAAGGQSILVECKATRSDFLSDKRKPFRKQPELGMGDKRYYFAPNGVIGVEDLPEKWGLLLLSPEFNRIYVKKQSEYFAANKTAEVTMLISIIRRVEIASAVFVVHENRPILPE